MIKKVKPTYLPNSLTKKDKKRQYNMLVHSRKMYKQGKFIPRKKLQSFKSKPSSHVKRAKEMYHVSKIGATNELAKATKCSKSALRQIIRKGEGAYYSSGSRPNQTAQSWGIARLAGAITGSKAAQVDYHILNKGCKKTSKVRKYL